MHLDPGFRRAVIAELVDEARRFVAPSYGYDVVPVLGHAVLARRRHRLRSLALSAGVIPLACAAITSGLLAGALLLLSLWWAWVVVFVDELVRRHTLISRLKRDPFTGQVPEHPLVLRRAQRIAQDQAEPVRYYSGFVPFVGAGTLMRNWSFSTILRSTDGGPTPRIKADDLIAAIATRLQNTLRDQAPLAERIRTLEISEQWYSTALRASRPAAASGGPAPGPNSEYDAPRKYLFLTIGSWDYELVTSIFVGFDVKGFTLHTELHSYQLLPIKGSFHEVDRLPVEFSASHLLDIALRSPFDAVLALGRRGTAALKPLLHRDDSSARTNLAAGGGLTGLLAAVLQLANVPLSLPASAALSVVTVGLAGIAAKWAKAAREREQLDPPHQATTIGGENGKITDWGARASIRDFAASERTHHFFQDADQDKYTKLIERRVMDTIISLLDDEYHVDVSEYRARQATILNFGIMQTGSGQIHNTGTLAAGVANAASTTSEKPTT
ncbi:hypothetical protein [Amycolatopsis sp. cmx-4-61]|uniref:hypothetical protein n=1 Tax=Amycolatopsis sp. cmx-4-61 TaxID=2790937 RepID=UPI003979405F